MPKTVVPKGEIKYYPLAIPKAYWDRLQELCKERFPYMVDYLNYLIRQEILRHGPLPQSKGKQNGR